MRQTINHQSFVTIPGAAFELTKFLDVHIFPEQIFQFALEYDLELSMHFPTFAVAKIETVSYPQKKKNKPSLAKHTSEIETHLEEIKGVFDIPMTPSNRKEIDRFLEIKSTGTDIFRPRAGNIQVEGKEGTSYLLYRPGVEYENDKKSIHSKHTLPKDSEIVVRDNELRWFLGFIQKTELKNAIEKERSEDKDGRLNSFLALVRDFQQSGKLTHMEGMQLAGAAGALTAHKDIDINYLAEIEKHSKRTQTEKARLKKTADSEEQQVLVLKFYKQLLGNDPKISKDKAAWKIGDMKGITIGQGRIRKMLYNH